METEEAAHLLANLMQRAKNLKSLNISDNLIEDASNQAIIIDGIKNATNCLESFYWHYDI